MSLITTSTPWQSNESGQKKRTPTIGSANLRKTIKIRPYEKTDESGEYIPEDFDSLAKKQELVEEENQDRALKINTLLNKITSVSPEDGGNRLADFKPIDGPVGGFSKKMESAPLAEQPNPLLPNPLIPKHMEKQGISDHSIASANLFVSAHHSPEYTNYHAGYDAPQQIPEYVPYYAKYGNQRQNNSNSQHAHASSILEDKYMEKINYMIHLLEQQQLDKTNTITEEFILYTLLGVFVIYIVDAFHKTGKYTR
jgi:hypothetical protein